MKGILGKKMGMTRVIDDKGNFVPVTVVLAGPCTVVQKKTVEKEGYNAIQVGFEVEKKPQRVNKPHHGHFKKANTEVFKHLAEFRTDKANDFNIGHVLTVEGFEKGEMVKVEGITKGRGFQGVIKRWGKHGGPATHGSHFHRSTGSIGMRTDPGRVLPNMKMPGHMGDVKVTTRKLTVVDIDSSENLLFIKGSIPGGRNGLVRVLSIQRDFEAPKA
jgi:large subunit ribosomal protein L3